MLSLLWLFSFAYSEEGGGRIFPAPYVLNTYEI